MKNILVINLTFYPTNDANTICSLNLLQDNDGYNFTVLTGDARKGIADEEVYNGVKIIRTKVLSLREELRDLFTDLKSFPLKLFILTRKLPIYLWSKLMNIKHKKDMNFDRIGSFLYHSKKLVNYQDYDLILSFANPIESHYCASVIKRKYGLKWVPYYFDPYFSNFSKTKEGLNLRKKTEEKLLNIADSIIVTDLIKQDFEKYNMNLDHKKINIFELPNIRPIKKSANLGKKIVLENQTINCVFVGNLYWKIRNPIETIKAFNKLEEHGINIYFVGGCFDGDVISLLKDEGIRISKNINFLGSFDHETAKNIMLDADILVNIGNTVENQMPSKIFDYISTGKPIINIYKLKDCPTLKYTKENPLCLDIFEGDLNTDGVEMVIKDFCSRNVKERLSYEKITKIYNEYTQSKVIERLNSLIDSNINS